MEIKGDLAYLSSDEQLALRRSSPLLIDMLQPAALLQELDARTEWLEAQQTCGFSDKPYTERVSFMQESMRLTKDGRIYRSVINQLLERQFEID